MNTTIKNIQKVEKITDNRLEIDEERLRDARKDRLIFYRRRSKPK